MSAADPYTSSSTDDEKKLGKDLERNRTGSSAGLPRKGSLARDPKYDTEDPFAAEDEVEGGTKYRTMVNAFSVLSNPAVSSHSVDRHGGKRA